MKRLLRLSILMIACCVSLPLYAGEPTAITPSEAMNVARECFLDGKNCSEERTLEAGTVQDFQREGYTADDAIKMVEEGKRKILATCKEARVNLAEIKSEDAIIVHDYKLLECLEPMLGPTAALSDSTLFWGDTTATNYYATEYDLGHISRSQYSNLTSSVSKGIIHFVNETQQNNALAQEVDQLKAQLSALQSQDHKQCRQIQLVAAMNGGHPPNCP